MVIHLASEHWAWAARGCKAAREYKKRSGGGVGGVGRRSSSRRGMYVHLRTVVGVAVGVSDTHMMVSGRNGCRGVCDCGV